MTERTTAPARTEYALGLMRRASHPLLPALVAMVIGWSLVSGELNENDDNWSGFVVAGDMFIDAGSVPSPILVDEGAGYDGQFFYRLALDPWTPEHRELGVTLDTPAWRHQRILYPVLVWFVSLGIPRLVPSALVLVNLLTLGAIGFAGGIIVRKFGLHAVWGALPALYPGFFLTIVRDTSEVVAAGCVIGAIAALVATERGVAWASVGATALLSLAVLARETTVLVAAAIVLIWMWERLRTGSRMLSWHHGIVPMLVMAFWHWSLYLRWGVLPAAQGSGNLGIPFQPLIGFARDVSDRQDHWESVAMTELWFLAVLAAITIAAIWWSRAAPHVKVAYLLYASLGASLSRLIWVEDWSFMRALTELHMMAAIIILGAPRWLRIAGALTWLAFARWMFVEIDDVR